MSIHLITRKPLPPTRLLLSCSPAPQKHPETGRENILMGCTRSLPILLWQNDHPAVPNVDQERGMSITQGKGILGNTMPVINLLCPFCSTRADSALVVGPPSTRWTEQCLHGYVRWCNADPSSSSKVEREESTFQVAEETRAEKCSTRWEMFVDTVQTLKIEIVWKVVPCWHSGSRQHCQFSIVWLLGSFFVYCFIFHLGQNLVGGRLI